MVWAAARLQHGVRDAINAIDGAPSDGEFEPTLGTVIRTLRKKAAQLPPTHRLAIEHWCDSTGLPAAEERNAVLHSIAITAEDGKQALTTGPPRQRRRWLQSDLLRAAGQLGVAGQTLPPPPYL